MTNIKLQTFDLPSFAHQIHQHSVGFDRMFEELNRTFANSRSDGNYPPHNIIRIDDTHYVVEIAVAGFAEDELDVELKDRLLTVKGQKAQSAEAGAEPEYLHKGIATRNFERNFTLMENVEVRAATVKNGVLAIALELVIPEEKKPKKVAVKSRGEKQFLND